MKTEKSDPFCFRIIKRSSPEYPEMLKPYPSMPQELYLKGSLPDPSGKTVAIVGARSCSMYGKNHALKLARFLAEHGVQIISGLAYGIDACAHQGAMDAGGKTFAVLGCGIDRCYPESNRGLYAKILSSGGGILSEYPPGSPALPHHFPIRNRIISALSDAVVVIEARRKSGSLITANYALEQGKTIYALPGRVYDELSIGCNELIEQGAFPLLSASRILADLGLDCEPHEEKRKEETGLTPDETKLIRCLTDEPKTLGDLIPECDLEQKILPAILIRLQLRGLIDEPVPGLYCRAY